jgi:hypothetical protein
VQPTICSAQGRSGLPVHFKSRKECVRAGTAIAASANTASVNALNCRDTAKTMEILVTSRTIEFSMCRLG